MLPGGLHVICVREDGKPAGELPIAEARYLAALDPGTVLALVEAARRDVPALLRAMPTDDARLEAMRGICRHCGRIEDENECVRSCQCWNDD